MKSPRQENPIPIPIRIKDLSRRFGRMVALDSVSFEAHGGDVILVIGPNGAGKTTLLRILSGLCRPTSGTFSFGESSNLETVSERLGYLSHETMLHHELTVRENLVFFARLYGLEQIDRTLDEILEIVGLRAFRDRPVGKLSRGMRQRAAIARTFLHRPSILLLDEPFTGLDDPSQHVLTNLIRENQERKGVCLLVTHDLASALPHANRILWLSGGSLYRNISWGEAGWESLLEDYRNTCGGRP